MWLLSAVNKNDNDERGVVSLGLLESTLFVLNFAYGNTFVLNFAISVRYLISRF